MSSPVDCVPCLPRPYAPWLLTLGGVVWLVAAFGGMTEPSGDSLQDFVEYWAAGRLNARGENPYDPATLYRQEKEVSPGLTNAIMMWNPPWTLSLVMPFSLLPVRAAHLLWLLLQLALLWGCTDWLWRYSGGSAQHRWLGWAVALAFLPTFTLLRMGQISAVVLLGVTGFLYFSERGRWAWAGAAAALTAVKPQLVLVFAAAVLLWAVDRRRWALLAGGALTLAALTLWPLACNPRVLQQYGDAMAHEPPQMLSPTLGSLLRLAFGLDRLWLQFVPLAFGLVWLAGHWLGNRRGWDWKEQTPLLLLVSFLTTSYGGWLFDLVVLLVAVIPAAVWVLRDLDRRARVFAVTALAGFDLMALLLKDVRWSEQYWHVWMTPMVLYVYVTLQRQRRLTASAAC